MLDVVVVNWNANGMLAACVNSVLKSDHAADWLERIIVVDNASTDNSIKHLESISDARVHIIRNNINVGFGQACNQGSRVADSELMLLLNPDVILEPDALDIAIDAITHGEEIGICGIQLVDSVGAVAKTCARRPTAWNMCVYTLGLGRSALAAPKSYIMNEWDHCESGFVHHVIGAFYLMRRSIFECVGGFDERFFMYLEDLDLSTRVADLEWKCLYVANARAHHEGGGTSKQIPGKRLFYAIRSRLQYAVKHFGVLGVLMVSVATLVFEPPLRILSMTFRRDSRGLHNTFEAYGLLIKWLLTSGKRVAD